MNDLIKKIKFARMSKENQLLGNIFYNSKLLKYGNYIEVYYNKNYWYDCNEVIRIDHKKKRIYFNTELNYVIKNVQPTYDNWYDYNSDSIINYIRFYFTKYNNYDIYGKLLK